MNGYQYRQSSHAGGGQTAIISRDLAGASFFQRFFIGADTGAAYWDKEEKSLLVGEKSVSLRIGIPLAIGAAAGGLAGNQLFAAVRQLTSDPEGVGAVQAGCVWRW